jgi:hypothetical protein
MKDGSFAPIRTILSCLYGPKNDTNACNSRFRPPKSTVLLRQALSHAVKGSNDDQEEMKECNLLQTE